MIPGQDVKFLLNVCNRMTERRLHVYTPGLRRSASVLLLRFSGETQRTVEQLFEGPRDSSAKPMDILQTLMKKMDNDAPSNLHLLFMKRADRTADRWSGQICFPGGSRDPEDVDDFDTACREVEETLGIPIRKSKDFIFLTRLRDYSVRSRVVDGRGLVQSRFLFLHVGAMTPLVRFASHQIDAVAWLPLSHLSPEYVHYDAICHPLSSFVQSDDADRRLILKELFPSAFIFFPSVYIVPQEEGEAARRSWSVWGLTLRSACELLTLGDRPPIDWPLFRSNSALLNYLVIYPYHGYYELSYQYYKGRAYLSCQLQYMKHLVFPNNNNKENRTWRKFFHGSRIERRSAILPTHTDALLYLVPESLTPEFTYGVLLLVCLCVGLMYSVASIIYTVATAVRIGLGLIDPDRVQERRKAYYEAHAPISVERERRRYAEQEAEIKEPEESGTKVAFDASALHQEEERQYLHASPKATDSPAADTKDTTAEEMKKETPPESQKPSEEYLYENENNSVDDVMKRYK
ncbi:NUDIX domain containing protein, putative [Angomonas deanei]|uniref:NUDIX domain containing protein, putative n=1 Tax=Angomonas deanei TaxID=59799 RepID=A0A7G2CRJ4_9TRYP|nr:NUDIX domain containing protein, putative [Angomonas deanei]